MIKFVNIHKSFFSNVVISDLSLFIPAHKTTVILGTSGCGKSTLLKMAAGLIRPDQGQVFFDGQLICAANIASVRKRIGYVIQEGGLFPHLTARENITLIAKYHGWEISSQNKRITELCELTHITQSLLSKYPYELSGGQRQRIGLMRALMLNPECLLLDEPLGALDPIIRSELQMDLKSIFQNQNRTVILVTHDLGEAFFLGDKIIILQSGKIAQMGTAREIVDNPSNDFVRKFINAQRPAIPDEPSGRDL
jgi:osmoprotectant transport system ATP-binding protein